VSITQKIFSSRALNVNADTYVGQAGHLFYTQTTATGLAPVLKYSDGATPGGLPLSGASLTFSSPTPPSMPHEGELWWDTNDGKLYIYYENTWVDASPYPISSSTGIRLSSLSVVTTSTSVVGGALIYNNSTGIFTYSPADATQLVNGGPSVTVDNYGNLSVPGNVSAAGFVTTGSIVIPNVGQAGSIQSQNGQGNIYFDTDNSLVFIITGTYEVAFNADGSVKFPNYVFPETAPTVGQVLVAGDPPTFLQWQDQTGYVGSQSGILKAPQTTKASTATGTPGQICWDADYIYVCTATNTWKRSPLTGGY